MDTKTQIETSAPYDVAGLVASAKRNLRNLLFRLVICGVLLVLSILAIVLYGSYLSVFAGGVILACVSVFFGSRLLKEFAFADYSSACGEIADVHKEIKVTHTTKVGGINPFGVRKYDHDGKNEIRLSVFIKDGERIRGYFLNDVNEDHSKYYESKDEVIHIWGAHFPVKLEIGKGKWLCPVCGEFNANGEKSCVGCKKKILN